MQYVSVHTFHTAELAPTIPTVTSRLTEKHEPKSGLTLQYNNSIRITVELFFHYTYIHWVKWYQTLAACSPNAHVHKEDVVSYWLLHFPLLQEMSPLQDYSKMVSNWTGFLLLNPMERCTMSYTTHQKVAQNSQLILGATWPTTTWQDLRETECTATLQCRLSI